MRLFERVQHPRARRREVGSVPRDDGQVADERRGGDLFVEGILGVRDTQAAPDLGHVGIEREK